jgi:hypothetical protein
MSPVGFETTIPVLERAKTVHALDRAVAVIGNQLIYLNKIKCTSYDLLIKIRKQYSYSNLKGRIHLEELDVDGRIMQK